MSCRILRGKDGDYDFSCFYDSVTGWAFGPVARFDSLNRFAEWLARDPREYSESDLETNWSHFCDGWESELSGPYCTQQLYDANNEPHDCILLNKHSGNHMTKIKRVIEWRNENEPLIF